MPRRFWLGWCSVSLSSAACCSCAHPLNLRTKKLLKSGQMAIIGDQWPNFVYAANGFDPNAPWNGLLRSEILVSVSHTVIYAFLDSGLIGIQAHIYISEFSWKQSQSNLILQRVSAQHEESNTSFDCIYCNSGRLPAVSYFIRPHHLPFRSGLRWAQLQYSPIQTPSPILNISSSGLWRCLWTLMRCKRLSSFWHGGTGASITKLPFHLNLTSQQACLPDLHNYR